MDTYALKKFAQAARRTLMEQVAAKLTGVLMPDSLARRENPMVVGELEKAIAQRGREQIVERVAYIWFNRFCALRFMDVNHYSRVGVVSPAEGQFQPEILGEAKMGHIDEDMVAIPATRERVFDLLGGKITSNDPQGEAYRLLLVAICNYWHKTMPFMFERIHDYAELLMPGDLLSESSILAQTRETMTEENCKDVEVIGWLYQFYISEKKDAVFEGLKKNKKVTPENIPAATQLFTPHWIVRYLVENSLGRLWMLNRPKSGLATKMLYYIKPEQPETDFLRVNSPEEIKICDPACGSGHMLTYAFDLLYAIYEEEGYTPSEIPAKILTHNLYGVEIDERAGALAAFALSMKARAKQRGFFRKPVQPRICVLQNVKFEDGELARYMDFIGHDLFTAPLAAALRQFEEADNFGALIRPEITDAAGMRNILEKKDVGRNLLLQSTHEKVLRVLEQSEYLSPGYHVVIANPPYMGGKGMNGRLGAWAKVNYPNSKSDLFAMFMERNSELARKDGMVAMITMQSWMFLSSFEAVRQKIISKYSIKTLVQIGYNSFPELNSKVVQCAAFVMEISREKNPGYYYDLNDAPQSADKRLIFLRKLGTTNNYYRVSCADFKKIPGTPIAYLVSEKIKKCFSENITFDTTFTIKAGICTGKNETFILYWHEVMYSLIFKENLHTYSYFKHNKGGDYRRWCGNWENILKYSPSHLTEMTKNDGFRHDGKEYYLRQHIGWSKITSSLSSFRFYPEGFSFDSAGLAIFSDKKQFLYDAILFLNSSIAMYLIQILNPTLNVTPQIIKKLPFLECSKLHRDLCGQLVNIAQSDWDSYETSWDFTTLPLLSSDFRQSTLAATYAALRAYWRSITLEMQCLEEENNRIFIEAYGLQDELTPDVPLKEITLTCNPHYRYGGDKTEEELEALLQADTMKEFISYAVGCMFGRYALEKPGLILANQGETYADYLKQVPAPAFPADKDNVIPMLDGEWFADDITERFRRFLRLTFGEEHYEENLAFIEQAIGKDIRKYFTKDFYNDHVKRYKKRPIYWLFSSPKGSFNALIYMHRYVPDTVSIVLNDYLREFQTKLATEKALQETIEASASSSPAEKAKATKKLDTIRKTIKELENYECDTLYPLATRQIAIDLDDGVKANYPKFGAALKKIPGLEAKEE